MRTRICAGTAVAALIGWLATAATAPASVLGIGSDEIVTSVSQPDTGTMPVFDRFFTASGAGLLGSDTKHVAIAAGNDRVWAASESDPYTIRAWRADTLGEQGSFAMRGNGHPRGLAFYRGELFVGDQERTAIQAYRPSGLDYDHPPMRELPVPSALKLVLGEQCPDGCQSMTLGANLRLVGLDVAWSEAWAVLLTNDGGRIVVALDVYSGVPKAVVASLTRFDCVSPWSDLLGGQVECENARASGGQIIAVCTQPRSPKLDDNGHLDTSPTVWYVKDCSLQVIPSVESSTVWDIAVAPERGEVLVGCHVISRSAIATALSTSSTSRPQAVSFGSDGCDETRQDGIDAVWGMHWLLESYSADGVPGRAIHERALQPDSTAKREWTPGDIGNASHRDVAYHARETRAAWQGELTGDRWMRATRCLYYVVSDADIFVVGRKGERWYELARGFQQVQLLLDGVPVAFTQDGVSMTATTRPFGWLCLNTDQHPSGTHTLTLKAYLSGDRTATATNPVLRIDHSSATGALTPPPRFVRGTVQLRGTMSDAHSGARDALVQRRQTGGSWVACGIRSAPDVAGGYGCAWETTVVADGPYELRAELRDNTDLGGPNVGFTPSQSLTVDNAPPTVRVDGSLVETPRQGPLEVGQPEDLTVSADDAGSGVTAVEVLVDDVTRASDSGACAGGCSRTLRWSLQPGDYSDGEHRVTVRATDALGHVRDHSWIVDVEYNTPETPEEDAALETYDDGPTDEPIPPGSSAATGFAPFGGDLFHAAPDAPGGRLDCTDPDEPANFDVYSLGSAFEGLPLSAELRRCDVPFPSEPVRANFVTFIYGDCTIPAGSDEGCAPPLEVQSWPACERSLTDYRSGPDGPLPYTLMTRRGVPAATFEGGYRLELYTGNATVVIFGEDATQLDRAALALVSQAATAPPGEDLPAPLAGALGGTLQCWT